MKIDPKIKQTLKNRLKQMLNDKKRQVTVTSAYRLGESEITYLLKQIPQLRAYNIEYAVDEAILAGYVIKIGSEITDLSLKGQLTNLKNLIYDID